MKANGFTLLEILVTLVVFGFLLLGLSQTVRFGLTAWQQDSRIAAGKTDLEAVDRTLRSIVENFTLDPDGARPSIEGTHDRVAGITRIRLPGSGLTPVAVEAGLAVSGTRLVLRWRPYRRGIPFGRQPVPAETELMDGVAALTIEYWRAPGAWVSQWHEADLPLLIRFRLSADRSAWRWPDIVIAPLLSRP